MRSQIFKFLALMIALNFAYTGTAVSQTEKPEGPKSSSAEVSQEERRHLEERMKVLAGGFGGMPTLPRIQGTIMLPDPDAGETITAEQ